MMKQYIYATYSTENLEKAFHTNRSQGLTSAFIKQIPHTQDQEPSHAHRTWPAILLRQLKSPFIYLLIIAALLSFFLEGLPNFFIIFAIIIANTLLGFFQEYRAEKNAALLELHTVHHVTVVRNGSTQIIASTQLVPGDLVILEPGDTLGCDVRFIAAHNLVLDESVLSGESEPVKKIDTPLTQEPQTIYQSSNLGFQGTSIISGSANAIVVATGSDTLFASMAMLTQSIARQSTFEKNMNAISMTIVKCIIAAMLLLLLLHGLLKPSINIFELLLFSIALVLSVIPQALPVVITLALSNGALQLAKHKVIVKRLSAIEDLGNISLLCTDKTGTLTENILTVQDVLALTEADPILLAAIASIKERNPFEKSLYTALKSDSITQLADYTYVDYIPFDPLRRYSTIVVKKDTYSIICLGSPEDIISLCAIADTPKLMHWIQDQTNAARRVIAVAYKVINEQPQDIEQEEHEMICAGFIAFDDPLKATAKDSIIEAKRLGVTIKILSGDTLEVAAAIGKQLNLIAHADEIITGSQFELLDAEGKIGAIERCAIFARVVPQQKSDIITLLKKRYTVAFLGEGINDSPGLKAADVGIVVSGASDIAKDAADIILLKKSLRTIIVGIEMGRAIFASTIKYVKITLSSNIGNFCSIAIASLLIDFLPIAPLQILLVNLLTDLPMIALATDSVDPEELTTPRSYNTHEIIVFSIIFGAISSLFDLLFFNTYFRHEAELQTYWFIMSVLTELVLIFSLRTHKPFYKATRPSLPLVSLCITASAIALLLPFTTFGKNYFGFIAPHMHDIVFILLLVLGYFCFTEITKVWYYKSYYQRLKNS